VSLPTKIAKILVDRNQAVFLEEKEQLMWFVLNLNMIITIKIVKMWRSIMCFVDNAIFGM
jgi:hypothetical protein